MQEMTLRADNLSPLKIVPFARFCYPTATIEWPKEQTAKLPGLVKDQASMSVVVANEVNPMQFQSSALTGQSKKTWYMSFTLHQPQTESSIMCLRMKFAFVLNQSLKYSHAKIFTLFDTFVCQT
jgi:hypothetical protein